MSWLERAFEGLVMIAGIAAFVEARAARGRANGLVERISRLERVVQGFVFAHNDSDAHAELIAEGRQNRSSGAEMAPQIRREVDAFMDKTLR